MGGNVSLKKVSKPTGLALAVYQYTIQSISVANIPVGIFLLSFRGKLLNQSVSAIRISNLGVRKQI